MMNTRCVLSWSTKCWEVTPYSWKIYQEEIQFAMEDISGGICRNLPFAITGLCFVLLFFLSGNTGGAKGIGKCICEEFEEQRAKVCVIDLLDNPSPGWIDVGYY